MVLNNIVGVGGWCMKKYLSPTNNENIVWNKFIKSDIVSL